MADFPGDQNDWLKHSNLDEGTRELMRKRHTHSRAFFSVFLIVAGVLLFLSNLGVLPVRDIWRFWPLLPLAAGSGKLLNGYDTAGRTWGIVLVCFGSLFLLLNLGVIHIRARDGSWPFSLLVIGAGVVALLNVLESSARARAIRRSPDPATPRAAQTVNDGVGDTVILGSLKRRVESMAFQGGNTLVIFGNIELDLRHALFPMGIRSLVINVQSIFGSTKIRVPQTWRVHLNAASILGNFEDKTIPPNTGADAPTLVISGYSIFSSVEVED